MSTMRNSRRIGPHLMSLGLLLVVPAAVQGQATTASPASPAALSGPRPGRSGSGNRTWDPPRLPHRHRHDSRTPVRRTLREPPLLPL